MSRYRRPNIEGGIFFFTVVLSDRSSELLVKHIACLQQAYRAVHTRRPFATNAICILPDHLHAIWTLPPDDADFASRWSQIKSGFSRQLPAAQLRSSSQMRRRKTGIWQRRFWEHAIRDDADFERHVDYIHFSPVKHGYVTRVRDWPYSSFHRYVKNDSLPADWVAIWPRSRGALGSNPRGRQRAQNRPDAVPDYTASQGDFAHHGGSDACWSGVIPTGRSFPRVWQATFPGGRRHEK